MLPWSVDFAGRLDEHAFESRVLEGNALGDPHVRPLWVYVPPGYDDEPERRYPSIYLIQGLTGQLDMWRNRVAFRKNPPELMDELFVSGEVPPAVLVWVDAWTSLGGSQFLDSPGTGRYHTYLCDEIVPWVDTNYRTLADAGHRGLAGDPVRMAPRHAEALRSQKAIYIDAGKRDDVYLDLGAEAFRRRLEELGIDDYFFELFDGTHAGIEYRYPLAVKYLAEKLGP